MIILASASPRRKEILDEMGIDYVVEPSFYEENNAQDLPPDVLAERQARGKAAEVARRLSPKCPVLGADTIVVLDGKVLGKPKDKDDAARMLSMLSGRTHEVITGVAVVSGDTIDSSAAHTDVSFRTISEEDIAAYIETGEPMDKAGAYAIQGIGGRFVKDIRGSRSNVIGLPKRLTAKLLEEIADGDDTGNGG